MQVCDRAREAGGAERGGPAHPADAGAGALAEGDDGAALQPVHGRTRGQSPGGSGISGGARASQGKRLGCPS